MNSAVFPLGNQISLQSLAEFAQKQIAQWFDVCNSFFDWQKKHLIGAAPSLDTLEEHKKVLKLLLRITRLLHFEASDPDFPKRALAEDFAWRLARLEDSWLMFHGDMTDTEADAIIQQVFPG
jgi:hypothetical protein